MTVSSQLLNGLSKLFQKAGTQISVTYYLQTTGSIYDEGDSLAKSGNTVWTSGIVFPLDPKSSVDGVLMQQGKLADGDIKLYVTGSLILGTNQDSIGSLLYTKVGIGSPGVFYTLIPVGGVPMEVESIKIFKRGFIRRLTGSLLIGE